MPRRSLPRPERARGVTAVLGPTNTGKTHLAIERLVAHSSGMIGLPLRLLAREVYGRVVEKVGAEAVALVTGEEKIKPERARYWIATVEAMPRDLDVAFVAIDEIQLAADLDRGHVFTDRLLNQRGREETLVIGSATMRPLVESLLPGVNVVTRPRLSNLSFAGDKKLSRLPARSAIVAFSAEEVYAIAELIRRHRGGAAVVLGALSPRTRNAQVALYQAGDVDYLVATDAIGMGLNLDVGHVAFASRQKYDGYQFRDLHPAELGQIAGRAGRHLRDGAFGSTGRCEPFDPETIDRLENHRFDPVRVAQWRSADLDFGSVERLLASLGEVPSEAGLTRALVADDEAALGQLAREEEARRLAQGRDAVGKLWEVCALPDYRRVSPIGHAELVGTIFGHLMKDGRVPSDWFARQLATVDRTDGEIDTLSQRLAHVRTWSFVANRPDWLPDPEHWQGVTRRVEDNLSDALHERLAARFVDRRTSVLMRRLRENRAMEAEISSAGDVTVEGQHVGHLHGFHFIPDAAVEGAEAKAALRNAAAKALAGELEGRAVRFGSAPDATIVLSNDGTLRWTGDPIAKLEPGDKVYEPSVRIVADEAVSGPARETIEVRLKAWLKAHIVRLLGPAMELENTAELTGLARGIAFQLSEGLGILERSRVAQDLRSLDQAGRSALRAKGVRFGAYHVYMPALIKPAPRILAAQLWALKNGGLDQRGIDELAHLAGSGRTSFPVDPEINRGLYRAAGFRAFATRAVRVDILERLADLIRPAVAYRPGVTPGEPPPGTADGDGFVATGAMTSLVGTSGDDFGAILRALGYVAETRTGAAITVPLVPARAPVAAAPSSEGASSAEPQASDVVGEAGLAPVPTLPPEAAGADATVDMTSIKPPPSDPDEPADADDPDPTVQEDAPDDIAPSQRALVDGSLEDAADRILAEAAPPEADSSHETSDETDEAPPLAGTVVEIGLSEDADEPAPSIQDEPEPARAPEPETTRLADPSPDEIVAAAPLLGSEPSLAGAGETADLNASIDAEADTDLADTPDDEARAIAAAAAPEAAEPVTVEVWRLHRPSRGARPAGRQGRRPDAREGRPDDRRAERRPGPPGGGEQRAGEGRQDEGRPRPGGFGRPPRGGGPGRPGRPPEGGAPAEAGAPQRRPESGERFGPRREGGGRPPHPRDERPRPEPRPERRERPADPNSPFAALAALKAQLEAKERDGR